MNKTQIIYQDQIIKYLNAKEPNRSEYANDNMFLRSLDWSQTPGPVKAILYGLAMNVCSNQICSVSFKLPISEVRTRCINGETPSQVATEIIKCNLGRNISFLGSMKYDHDVFNKGLHVNLLLPLIHDLERFEIEYLQAIENIATDNRCLYEVLNDQVSIDTKDFGFWAEGSAAVILENLHTPNATRRILHSKSVSKMCDHKNKCANSKQLEIIESSLRDIKSRRSPDSFYFDDLIFQSEDILEISKNLAEEFKPQLVDSYHTKIYEAA